MGKPTIPRRPSRLGPSRPGPSRRAATATLAAAQARRAPSRPSRQSLPPRRRGWHRAGEGPARPPGAASGPRRGARRSRGRAWRPGSWRGPRGPWPGRGRPPRARTRPRPAPPGASPRTALGPRNDGGRDEGFVRRPPRLEEGREVRAGPPLRDAQARRSRSRVEPARAGAGAPGRALARPLVAPGADPALPHRPASGSGARSRRGCGGGCPRRPPPAPRSAPSRRRS